MTNVMAVVHNPSSTVDRQGVLFDNTSYNTRFGVVLADGLGSNGREVTRGNQKVFRIGQNYVLGTGRGDHITFVMQEIAKNPPSTPQGLGDRIIRTSRKYIRFDKDDVLHFIIAGGNPAKKLEVYRLHVTSIQKPLLCEGGFAIDGSGADFVGKALEREGQLGLSTLLSPGATLAETVSSLYDLGHVARKSAGVNEEFQYGFITPSGLATLYHPRVWLAMPPREYSDKNGKFLPQIAQANNEMYWALDQHLYKAYQTLFDFNRVATALRQGHDTQLHRLLIEIGDERTRVLEGITRRIMDYVRLHNQDRPKNI